MAGSQGLIVQAWMPEEAVGQDWGDGAEGVKTELWNDCFLVYEMLWNRACIDSNADRIHMLWGDGADYRTQGNRYSPLARCSLAYITDGRAEAATIESTFGQIGVQVDAGDTFFCYTWGHGGHDGPLFGPRWANHYSLIVGPIAEMDSSFSGVELWDTTFARMADTVNCNRVFIMQQCFSGGFIDDLADSSTTMVCASAAGKKAWSADNDSRDGSPWPEHEVEDGDTWRHVEFTFHFLNALRGEALAPYVSPDTQPRIADANQDGNVTLTEAFAYADSFDSQEQPVMVEAGAFWRVMPPVPFADRNKGLKQGGAASAVPDTSSEDTTRIYVLKGNRTDEFWAYFPEGDSWKQCAAVPQGPHGKEVSKGGTLAATLGRRAFVTKGNGTHEFWQFNGCSTWTRLADFPAGASGKPPSKGAAVAVVYDDTAPSLYYTRGFRTLDFLRYDPAFDSWTT